MAIWIQSLSWTLVYALGQGLIIYTALRLLLRMLPAAAANARYHLSLSALCLLFAGFIATWWQQYHALLPYYAASTPVRQVFIIQAQGAAAGQPETAFSFSLLLQRILPWLSVAYAAGLAMMLLRLLAGLHQLSRLRSDGATQVDNSLESMLHVLRLRLNVKMPVRLLLSARAQVPMVIGCIKPVILLPAAALTQLSADQLETILLHELAHIRRSDYLVNILQAVVETLLFFNPFAWLISANIRREREHCCDDLVLVHTREPLFYATALATLAAQSGSASALAIAASGQPHHLLHRIKRIMEMKKHAFSYSRMMAAVLIITVIACSAALLTPSMAQTDKQQTATDQKMKNQLFEERMAARNLLTRRIIEARLVDDTKGYTIEKKYDKLFINGQLQQPGIAAKYLQSIKEDEFVIEIYPVKEWKLRHQEFKSSLFMRPFIYRPSDKPKSDEPGC